MTPESLLAALKGAGWLTAREVVDRLDAANVGDAAWQRATLPFKLTIVHAVAEEVVAAANGRPLLGVKVDTRDGLQVRVYKPVRDFTVQDYEDAIRYHLDMARYHQGEANRAAAPWN